MDCSPPGSSIRGGKNTGVGYHALLQGIVPTQGSNQHLLCLLLIQGPLLLRWFQSFKPHPAGLTPPFYLFVCFWLCWVFLATCWLCLVAVSGGYFLVMVHRLLIVVASVVVGRGLQSAGSVVVVHGFSCSAACGIFLDQGSNPYLLH